jgi:hypothetical protein
MRASVALLALALAGCTQQSIRPPDLGPVSVSCSAECKASCLPSQWPQWTGNPDAPETWDALAEQVALPLQEIAKACNAARASCLRCIAGMEGVGIVCGVTRECVQ